VATLCTVNISISSVSHCVTRITAVLAAAAAAAVSAAVAVVDSQQLLQQQSSSSIMTKQHCDELGKHANLDWSVNMFALTNL